MIFAVRGFYPAISLYLTTRANLRKKQKLPSTNIIGIFRPFHPSTNFRKFAFFQIGLRFLVTPRHGFGKLKLAEARKAMRDYRKATGNVAGTVDLLLTYVENGTEFTQQFGDINEAYYNSLESALNELTELLRGPGRECYPQCRHRLGCIVQLANHIGWGYGDYVRDHVVMLEDELAGP